MLLMLLLVLRLGGQRSTRPSEAVDRVVRCLAEWPETGQTDTVLLILWLGVTIWREAGRASSRCAFGRVVWGNRNQLAGWPVGALQRE